MGMPDADGNGQPDGLPDLPPEWGRVVVPDDASALADEAEELRRELRARARQAGRPPGARSALTLPVLILLVAVLTTLAGLAAVTWPRAERPGSRPGTVPTASRADPTGQPLPALDLVDAAQTPVPLRSLLPAVILLVDACPCPEQVAATIAATPPGVQVITVAGRAVPTTAADEPGVRHLADPAGGLRALLQVSPGTGAVSAILVDRFGTVVRAVRVVDSVEEYRADLVGLAG